jgi:D-beta-D-heptose 7-phosphate kinase/D-beta-D-heptose 1-phosphate adenosyltransferase
MIRPFEKIAVLIDLESLLARFASRQILIVGDVMLNEYLWGDVRRFCPEAPVPIVESRDRSARPGGAANSAANIAALGATAWLHGVIGSDHAGESLRAILKEANVEANGLLFTNDRPTTCKTRVIAHSQQVLRIDTEQTHPLPRDVADRLVAHVDQLIPRADTLLLCDYAKGVLSPEMTAHVIQTARRAQRPIVKFERYVHGNAKPKRYLHRHRQFRSGDRHFDANGHAIRLPD